MHADGDAMGSVLGLWRILKNAGLKVKVISPTKYPEFYHWMDGHEEVIIYSHHPKQSARALEESDLLICMDFNQLSRLGDMKALVESYPGKKSFGRSSSLSRNFYRSGHFRYQLQFNFRTNFLNTSIHRICTTHRQECRHFIFYGYHDRYRLFRL